MWRLARSIFDLGPLSSVLVSVIDPSLASVGPNDDPCDPARRRRRPPKRKEATNLGVNYCVLSARFHTSSAFPPDEVRATPKVKSSPASLMIDHF